MKRMIALVTVWLAACSGNDGRSDAYGNFEATEYVVSAQASGSLLAFEAEEGATLDAGVPVGIVDTIQPALKREQLRAMRQAAGARIPNIIAQIDVLKEQKNVALVEKARLERLFKENAATQKQLDDVNGQIGVIDKQIVSIETQNASILGEIRSLDAQIEQLDDQMAKCRIVNPVRGTVLATYVEPTEVVSYGKPLYQIADLSTMFLRAYVSGAQLPHLRIGQKVDVLVDESRSENRALKGEVSWISDKAEFTPKIIQTKEERVNLVYAIKVRVANDGSLKIGMPGEVRFTR